MRRFDKKQIIREANLKLEWSFLNKFLGDKSIKKNQTDEEINVVKNNKNKIVIKIKSQQELERARTILKKYGEPIDDSSFKFHDTEFFNYLQYLGYPYNSWGLYDNVPSVTSHINRILISLDELESLLSMSINESNERLEEKAIGFKTAGDNRDKDTVSSRVKLGFKPTKDVEEKVITIMKKLKNLSKRGETGEKESAKKKLEDLSKKYGISISSLDSRSGTLGYKQSKDDKETLKDIEKEILKLENIIRIKELI